MADVVGLEKNKAHVTNTLKKRAVEKYSFFELMLVKMLKSY